MNPENRKNITNFVLNSQPIEDTWTEKRLAFTWGDKTYLITDNFPHWTISQILDFLDSVNIKPFELTVNVEVEKRW